MFGILAKFFRFSGRENGNKLKLSIVIGLIEALASAMKIPAIMYILIGLLSGKPTGKYIGGSVVIMVLAIVVDVICKRYSTVLQTEGGYNASAFMRIKIAEHLRYLPMGYFNSNSIGEISSITTNTMEILGDVAARVVMLTMQGILEQPELERPEKSKSVPKDNSVTLEDVRFGYHTLQKMIGHKQHFHLCIDLFTCFICII